MLKDSYVLNQKVVPIHMVEANNKTSKKSPQTLKRTQFPLTPTWVCTVHKGLGLALIITIVFFELVKQRTFSPGQVYVALSRSTSLSKLNILSNFDPKVINASHLALSHHEYLRKKKNLFTTTFSQRKSIVEFKLSKSDVCGMLTNISNLMGDSRLVNVPFVCLIETQLSSATVLRDVFPTYEIVRNDGQFNPNLGGG